MKKMGWIFLVLIFALSVLSGCDTYEKIKEMGLDSFKNIESINQEIGKEIGVVPETSWRIHNGQSVVHVHFSSFVDDKITVMELRNKVADIVVPNIGFEIDSFYISINGNEN